MFLPSNIFTISRSIFSPCFDLLISINLDELAEQIDLDEEEVIRKQREARQVRIAQLIGKNSTGEVTPSNTNRSFSDSDGDSSSNESSDESDQSSVSDSTDLTASSESESTSSSSSEDEGRVRKMKHKKSETYKTRHRGTKVINTLKGDEKLHHKLLSNGERSNVMPEVVKNSKKGREHKEGRGENKAMKSPSSKKERNSRKRKNSNSEQENDIKRLNKTNKQEIERKKVLEHRSKIAETKKLTLVKEHEDGEEIGGKASFDMFAGDEAFTGNDMFAENFDVCAPVKLHVY